MVEVYRWHTEASLGLSPEIHEIEPQAGWYKMPLVRGGAFVPVEIWLDQVLDDETGELAEDELVFCTVNGFSKPAADVWTRCCKIPISKDEFDAMNRGESGAGQSDPMKKVNLMMKATGPNG